MEQSRFWDKVADRYSKQPIADEAAYQKKLQVTREYFRPDMKVFEFGCGTGSTAIAHSPYVKHIRAIDVSSKMIEIAERKAAAENIKNVTFERSSFDEFNPPDRTFDAVLALSVLHLVEDRDTVIAKVHRILKPGGTFVTSTACLGDSMFKYIKLVGPVGRFLGFLPLVKVFTTKQLEDSLSQASFEIDYRWQPGKTKAVFIVAKKIG